MNRTRADLRGGAEAKLLEHRSERRDLQLPVMAREAASVRTRERVQHLHGHRRKGVGVVIDLDRPDVRLLLLPIEPVDVELRPFMQVDGLFVEEDRSGELVHLAEDLRTRMRGVDDDHVVRSDSPEVYLLGGKGLAAPEPPPCGAGCGAVLLKNLQQVVDVCTSELFLIFERQLEKAGLQVTGEDEQIVRVDQAFLGVGAEEVVGMPDDELIERGAGRHENTDGAGAPTRAAKLLPRG